jgi:gamma-glutamylcyclotransferase (GGCT)/AIG2-like uncharacterized protein YtfP
MHQTHYHCQISIKNIDAMENVFSYGTLQLEKVQLEIFGRRLLGHPDALIGYKKETIKIKVNSVVDLSGIEEHAVVVHTGNSADVIEGVVLKITPEELEHADAYETDDYQRTKLTLLSGQQAWVYIKTIRSKKCTHNRSLSILKGALSLRGI